VSGIPEGRVDKRFDSFEILRKISPQAIRITPNAANHVSSLFARRLYNLNMDLGDFDQEVEQGIIRELRNAIPRGLVLNNHQSEDSHNPMDRQLEIYAYIDLGRINLRLKGIAKLKILCRLSLLNGSLSLRTIQRNFVVD
jgi:hypothetical protein